MSLESERRAILDDANTLDARSFGAIVVAGVRKLFGGWRAPSHHDQNETAKQEQAATDAVNRALAKARAKLDEEKQA